MSYPSKNPIYLKLVYTSLSNQIKFENHKSSLPLKSFIVCLSTALKHNVKHNEDPALKREASLRRFLRKLKEKNFFNENVCDKLYSSGSAPASIYGTLKLHKFSSSNTFPKHRPIASSKGTFDFNFAGFLCDLFSPLAPDDYSCKDTFSFVSQIKDANYSGKFLVSYDVTSLSTNIPLQETIDSPINLSSNQNPNLNITKKEL